MNEEIVLACYKTKFVTICQPRERKRNSLFPKWWCFVCKKYILPDKQHRVIFKPTIENTLRIFIEKNK